MAPRYPTISFLSDYGHADEFVGVVKSVIRTIAPDVAVIDITHDIEPHDVRAGALTLARSVQYLAPGVVVAVVDPGVGTARRGVAIEVGAGEAVLVGPDNGLLAPAVALVGGADRAVELTNPEFQLPAPGATFAGRDIFGPAAAHLCNGVPFDALGDPVPTATLLPGMMPLSREEEGRLVAEILWVDRYGNAQLNVDPADLDGWGDRVQVRWAGQTRTAVVAGNYAAIGPGQVGLVIDSYGLLAIAVDRGSAAAELGLDAGTGITLAPLADDDDERPTTPVTLRPRRPA